MFSVERETRVLLGLMYGKCRSVRKNYTAVAEEAAGDRCGKAVLGSDRRPCPRLDIPLLSDLN